MVRAAQPGARPAWGRSAEHPSVLVETARGDIGLQAGVRVLEEFLRRTNTVPLEVVRARTSNGAHEAIYVRCGPPPTEAEMAAAQGAELPDLQPVTARLEQMTSELSAAVLGTKS